LPFSAFEKYGVPFALPCIAYAFTRIPFTLSSIALAKEGIPFALPCIAFVKEGNSVTLGLFAGLGDDECAFVMLSDSETCLPGNKYFAG
jgi:hypothetical protein